MSYSPPIRRLSSTSTGSSSAGPSGTASRRHEEELINAYEAEEERIINVLSRKLEQLREDKIDLENALEAESENHVNRLSRELGALRIAHQQLQQQLLQVQQQQQQQPPSELESSQRNGIAINGHPPGVDSVAASPAMSLSASPDTRLGYRAYMASAVAAGPLGTGANGMGRGTLGEPSAETMLEAMRRENEQLRNRLVDTERDYVRISRLNEVYREELIEHRRRLGISVDNLIGLASADPYAQPTHHRSASTSSSMSSSPSTSVFHIPTRPYPIAHSSLASTSSHGVPIPRPASQIHRPMPFAEPDAHAHHMSSTLRDAAASSPTPLSPSPYASDSSSASSPFPFPFSPAHSHSHSANPASFVSVSTNLTSPPSSLSFGGLGLGLGAYAVPQRGLSYPSVPPPSLSSSFGSPTVSFHMPHRERDPSMSPVEPLSRRNSNAGAGGARRGSLGGGARVVETGSLVRNVSASASRRASFDRGPLPIGGRVAETGSLAVGRRSRAGSVNQHGGHATGMLPETVVEAEGDVDGMELGVVVDEQENAPGPSAPSLSPSLSTSTIVGIGGGGGPGGVKAVVVKGSDSDSAPAKSR